MRVALGQLLLAGGGDQDVAVGLQDVPLVWRRVGETHDGPVSLQTQGQVLIGVTIATRRRLSTADQFVLFQLFGIHAVGVPDAPVHFSHSDTLCPVTMEVAHGVKTHVTETLRGKTAPASTDTPPTFNVNLVNQSRPSAKKPLQ